MAKQPQPVDLIASTITHAIQHVSATRMHLAAAATEAALVGLVAELTEGSTGPALS